MPNIAAIFQDLAIFKGVEGCVLLDAETSMAWHFAGPLKSIEHIGEVAIEFWRVQKRLSLSLGFARDF